MVVTEETLETSVTEEKVETSVTDERERRQ